MCGGLINNVTSKEYSAICNIHIQAVIDVTLVIYSRKISIAGIWFPIVDRVSVRLFKTRSFPIQGNGAVYTLFRI